MSGFDVTVTAALAYLVLLIVHVATARDGTGHRPRR